MFGLLPRPSTMSVFRWENGVLNRLYPLEDSGHWPMPNGSLFCDTYNQRDPDRRQPYGTRSLPIGR
jgi:hypothetical protein